jgi:hypothetical protein
MQKVRMLAKALNIALAELREVCETERMNCFDDVMRHLPSEVREYIKVDMSPVYWENNDYNPEYVKQRELAKRGELYVKPATD